MKNLAILTGAIVLAAGLTACSAPDTSSPNASGTTPTTTPTPTASSSPAASPTLQPTPAATTPAPTSAAPPVNSATSAPPAAAPAPAPNPAAWCTATASVYNAKYNWNNVYVHSNQPYRSATASADGHSWSYETDGSGYALIYLNGPPPGATITVTVGGATCTTSD